MQLEYELEAIELRRDILEWRDQHFVDAELKLRRACLDSHRILTDGFEKTNAATLFLGAKTFCSEIVSRVSETVLEPALSKVAQDAARDFEMIAKKSADLSRSTTNEDEKNFQIDLNALGDISVALAPVAAGSIAIGVAMLSAPTSYLVLGGGALLGAAAMPVLIGGAVLATAGAAYSGTAKNRRSRKLVNREYEKIAQLYLLSADTTKPAALELVQQKIQELAERVTSGDIEDDG